MRSALSASTGGLERLASGVARLGRVMMAGVAIAVSSQATGQSSAEVDLTLVLAVDCSYSVDDGEFALQMQGLARAFVSHEVAAAIASGAKGRIAVTLVQWAGYGEQQVVVPWTVVANDGSAERLALAIDAAPRRIGPGSTSISSALDFAMRVSMSSPYRGQRAVIDISSDGTNNNGAPPDASRDRAIVAGRTVNGLVIMSEVFYLDIYFKNHVAGGRDHFVERADTYADYGEAILRKLVKEISRPTA
ncbi:MAG: DUF1194 domain-containing protein [Hyphomicrobiaceae bacterium]